MTTLFTIAAVVAIGFFVVSKALREQAVESSQRLERERRERDASIAYRDRMMEQFRSYQMSPEERAAEARRRD